MMKRMLLAAALGAGLLVAGAGLGGCVQVGGNEPLVRLNNGDESELRRLQTENQRLKQRVAELERELTTARGGAAPLSQQR